MEADVGGAIERRVAASVEALGGLDVLGNSSGILRPTRQPRKRPVP